MRNLCVEISGHGNESGSSERPEVALVKPITVSHFNDELKNQRCKYYILAIIEESDYFQACGSVVLVVRTAREHE